MKILVVSGTRADWGLLLPVLRAIEAAPGLELRLAITGQHLAPSGDIDALLAGESFTAHHRIDMGLADDDSPRAIGEAMGRGLSGMARLLAEDRPDLMLVLGDRYEILAMVSAAQIARVPVAHIAGGDITEGAFDDAIRHAITKLSALHFVTSEEARRRVLQLGEEPEKIFPVGSPGIDAILQMPRMDKAALLQSVGLEPAEGPLFLITFHPETLADDHAQACAAMLEALRAFPQAGMIFTGSNADPGARAIDAMIRQFVAERDRAVFHQSLGSQRYFSALEHADVVIGNSSSGLYEAPSFGIPTVNIGDRQARRLRASSVIDCPATAPAVRQAIAEALQCGRDPATVNPYGDGRAAEKIVAILSAVTDAGDLVKKRFQDR